MILEIKPSTDLARYHIVFNIRRDGEDDFEDFEKYMENFIPKTKPDNVDPNNYFWIGADDMKWTINELTINLADLVPVIDEAVRKFPAIIGFEITYRGESF